MEKVIKTAVISLGFLGDTLLTEPLCANIKQAFPESELLFFAKDIFQDIPKGFADVDKVYPISKTGKYKGLKGYLHVREDLKQEKNVDFAIITHPHERSLIIAKLIGAKKIISVPIKKSIFNIFINKKRRYIENEIRNTYKADYNNFYLKDICEFQSKSVKYIRNDLNDKEILAKFGIDYNYNVLSPTSKDKSKDWDYENTKNFILNSAKKTVLVGTKKASVIAAKLKDENINFTDLTMKTSISQLGVILKNADCCVSVDTGTMHFSYAQNVKTLGLFFNEKMIKEWTPKDNPYLTVITGNIPQNENIISKTRISYQDVLSRM